MLSLLAGALLVYGGLYLYDCGPGWLAPLSSGTWLFLVPAIVVMGVFLLTRQPLSAVGAAAGAFAVLWSLSTIGCSPYEGGGAAMLEIPLLLAAPVASIALGGLAHGLLSRGGRRQRSGNAQPPP